MTADPIEVMQTLLRRTQNRSYLIAATILVSVLVSLVSIWLEFWWLAFAGTLAFVVNIIAGLKNYRLENDLEREIEKAIAIKWKLPR